MSDQLFHFSSQSVLITGGAGGLGFAAAEQFKRLGAKVIVADRNKEKLEKGKQLGLIDHYFVGDLTDTHFQNLLMSELSATVDILINNVGAGFSKTLEETTDVDFMNLWRLNFLTTASLCRGFIPSMAHRGRGKVINVSTVLADNPLPTVSAYVASKAAVISFTRSIALQFAPYGVQVNVVAPGYIENPKHKEYFSSQNGIHFAQRFMPTGQVGKEDAITGSFLFLASNLSDHITGQVIKVDGGYSIW